MYKCKYCGEITDRLYFLIDKQSEKMCEKCVREKYEILKNEGLWMHGFMFMEGEKNNKVGKCILCGNYFEYRGRYKKLCEECSKKITSLYLMALKIAAKDVGLNEEQEKEFINKFYQNVNECEKDLEKLEEIEGED